MHQWHGRKPESLSGYLEAMSFAIFAAGINWRVADLKHNFKFLGDTSAYFFPAAVDEPVSEIEEGAFTNHRARKA